MKAAWSASDTVLCTSRLEGQIIAASGCGNSHMQAKTVHVLLFEGQGQGQGQGYALVGQLLQPSSQEMTSLGVHVTHGYHIENAAQQLPQGGCSRTCQSIGASGSQPGQHTRPS